MTREFVLSFVIKYKIDLRVMVGKDLVISFFFIVHYIVVWNLKSFHKHYLTSV